ncbi:MAG: beta-ketoacyl-[acyl-carrier-protein] synthase family protein [Planctomycetota bacterium]
MADDRRVVITGMGWVTPLGCDVDGVWARLIAGESAVRRVEQFDAATFATNFAAEVANFSLGDHLGDAAARHSSAGRSTGFALAAAERAWRQAGLGERDGSGRSSVVRSERLGLYLGAGEGSMDVAGFSRAHIGAWNADERRLDDGALAAGLERLVLERELAQEPQITVSHVAAEFGCRGPSMNCMTACAASTQAIGEAAEIVRRGGADVMLTGGSHSMIHPLGMTGFIRLTAMSTRRDDPGHASRPFDRTRDGFVMGEGAGVLVLESREHAEARGATPLAEIAGYGSSADAYRITDIDPEGNGAALAMEAALRQAGIDPRAVGGDGRPGVHYLSAHGTGTPENDGIETRAVKRVFGPQADRVPFSSVKSMLGHLIQAAGAVELITCVQAIRTGVVPPTINLREPDADCDLDHVPLEARDLGGVGGVAACLSNSFGFGGQNDTLVVRRPA